jgi:hypothetical protein
MSNYTEQKASWGIDSYLASQEIPLRVSDPTIYFRVHKSPLPVFVQSQQYTPWHSKIFINHSNIILPCMPTFPE